jgi:Ion channel
MGSGPNSFRDKEFGPDPDFFGGSMDSRRMRRNFGAGLLSGLRVVWPILSILLVLIVGLGVVVGLLEGWSLHESIYFAFVSGLTIGYGDLAPTSLLTRALSIAIGVCGVLVTALVAAIAVKALTATTDDGKE